MGGTNRDPTAQRHLRETVLQGTRATEYSFYAWRKRLQEKGPVRFALVEGSALQQDRTTEAVLELVLASGVRLRIGTGVDAATLRTVLDALRG